jgi:hypothetical protein
MINTYYYVNTSAEVEAILRDGFIDEYKETTTGMSGVYLASSPGEPEPDYPDDELLEITLPAEISISQFERFKEGCRWREWLLPASLLNECAEIRPVTKAGWQQKWSQWQGLWIVETRTDLVAKGLLEQAKDAQGQPLYQDGQPVWRLTEKGEKPKPEIIRQNAEAFEELALKWMDSRTGKPARIDLVCANPAEVDLRRAVIYMILDYFDCDNSADLYYGDLLAAVEEKLRLTAIKFRGLRGLPRKKIWAAIGNG